MFQTNWSDKASLTAAPDFSGAPFDRVNASYWCEHCVECSQPACYASCENYLRRRDGRCRQTYCGMVPDGKGGVRLKFRKWGKLETKRFLRTMSVSEAETLEKRHASLARATDRISRFFRKIDRVGLIDNGFYFLWNRYLLRGEKGEKDACDALYLSCESHTEKPFRLIAEAVSSGGIILSRRALDILPGKNEYSVPLDIGNLGKGWANVVRILPENGLEADITLHTLQIVRMKSESANKVKCVLWDLDGTLWHGIMTEHVGDMRLRDGILNAIKSLDEKGILQTIVSKNDFEPAMEQLKKLGIAEYFLAPAIGWGQKSKSVKAIANLLNLNANSFLFVDDSPFERAEVSENVAGIRVCDENEIFSLLESDLFRVPVTDESKKRRAMYQVEMVRVETQASFGSDYIAFLRDCGIRLTVMDASSERARARCLELCQRTNQLNMTGTKYEAEAFDAVLNTPSRRNIAVSCRDRFGEYGIIAFVSSEWEGDVLRLREMTVSCRVAKKYVEDAILSLLAGDDFAEIVSDYKKTPRNTPMREALEDMGFRADENGVLRVKKADFSPHDAGIQIETVKG